MSLLVRAFPLVRPPADLLEFIAALQGERKADAMAFYKEHGVTHESWYLQETAAGPLVIGLTQVTDLPTASESFARNQTGFPAWFKEQVQALSGVNQNESPNGPPTKLVYEYSDTPQTRAHFAPFGA